MQKHCDNGLPEDFYLPEKERCGCGRKRNNYEICQRSSENKKRNEVCKGNHGCFLDKTELMEHSREGIQAWGQRWWERCVV